MTTPTTLESPAEPAAGREDRLARLFDVHQRRLFLLALRMAPDREEARDLVQETFLRAARQTETLPAGNGPGEAWLVRTLVNLCKDRYRRLAVRARTAGSLGDAGEPGTAHPEAAEVARATVKAALARLSPRRRAVIALHELEGAPVRDVARLLGVTEVTVRWHLLAARRELARLLSAGGGKP
jgi:RNA polymerase sigma-70 factor (ECF subfamily)